MLLRNPEREGEKESNIIKRERTSHGSVSWKEGARVGR